MGVQGQDWASYQDYTPSTAGLSFVFVKQTEGLTYTNPKAASQIAHARSDGLVVGHYHYPHMANNAATEADRFLAVAKPQPGDVLGLDWEGYDASNKGVAWSRQVAYKEQFLARLQATAPLLQHLVYCSADYVARDPKGAYGDGLWIATAGKPAGQPGISHSWLIHQYSTAGGIDHDYCPLTAAQLKTWAHAKENDMPLTDADVTKVAAEVVARLTAPAGRDALAAANVYWLHRVYDPAIALPAGKTAPGVAAEVAAFRPALQKALAAGGAQLSDAQVGQLATALAANATFAATLAEQVADKLAARLQS
jgi:hypothetical protein